MSHHKTSLSKKLSVLSLVWIFMLILCSQASEEEVCGQDIKNVENFTNIVELNEKNSQSNNVLV